MEFDTFVQWCVCMASKDISVETLCSKMSYREEFTVKKLGGNCIINDNFLKKWKGFVYQNSKEGKGSNLD